jgi:hypothetical protein
VAAFGSCVSGSLVPARVRGLCTVLVAKSGAVEDCQSWRVQSRTRELPLAIVMLTLCRNFDFCLRASQPEPPASFSRSPSTAVVKGVLVVAQPKPVECLPAFDDGLFLTSNLACICQC